MEPLVVEGGWTPTGRGWTRKKKTQKKGGCGGGVELIRTVKLRLWPDKETEEKLLRLCTISMKLWDELNHERRKLWKEGRLNSEGMKRTGKEVYEKYKKEIGARTASMIIWKNAATWRTFFALLEAKRRGELLSFIKVRPPGSKRRRKRRELWTVIRKDQYKIVGDEIEIMCLGELGRIRIKYSGEIHVKGEPAAAEIHYDDRRKRWYMHIALRRVTEVYRGRWIKVPQQPKGSLYAGVDLGVDNLLAVYVENGDALLVPGRPIKSEGLYWRERGARLQRRLARHGLRTSRRLQLMWTKEKLRRRDLINRAVRNAVEWLHSRGVSVIVIGYPIYIAQEGDKSSKVNYEVNNIWSYHVLTKRLIEVAEEYGIKVVIVDEAHTSQTCPLCNSSDEKHERVERGLFKCYANNIVFNADLVGAFNILRKVKPDVKPDIAALTGARVQRIAL